MPTQQSPHLTNLEESSRITETSKHLLTQYLKEHDSDLVNLKLLGQHEYTLTLPISTLQLFNEMLHHLARGDAVEFIAQDKVLTTQEAADLLHVSRPYLIGLLENQQIPYHKVGSHRRLYLRDLLNYKFTIDQQRLATLNELTAQAQELDMGY
ncbi:MAG: excisionase family DNA-binding protein [Deinococcales bacterium]